MKAFIKKTVKDEWGLEVFSHEIKMLAVVYCLILEGLLIHNKFLGLLAVMYD